MTDSFKPLSVIAAPILAQLCADRGLKPVGGDQAPLQPKPDPQPAKTERG